MERFVEKIVQKCVQMNLIEEDQSDWLSYSLQRRFYEHCGLSVPYPLGRSYSPFPASVTFKSWLGIFERKDKWAAYANEIVMFLYFSLICEYSCLFILHQLQAKVSFVSIILLIISTGVIVVLAPCNNAEIHCSSLELQSIKNLYIGALHCIVYL